MIIGSASALVQIYPSPKSLSLFSDPYFYFNVTISGVDNVYGFQFDLHYDPNAFEITNVSDISAGTFLSRNGQDQIYCMTPGISTPGFIDNFGCTRIGSGSVSGSGTLAVIRLKTKASISVPYPSSIILSNVKISDINSQPLNNSFRNGSVTIYECISGETRTCLGGTRTCGSSNVWGNCVVPTGGGPSGGGAPPGGGTPTPPEEEDEYYNVSGDLNGDGCVDDLDLMIVGVNLGLISGFDPVADVNKNGKVTIFDMVLVALNFGNGPNC